MFLFSFGYPFSLNTGAILFRYIAVDILYYENRPLLSVKHFIDVISGFFFWPVYNIEQVILADAVDDRIPLLLFVNELTLEDRADDQMAR